MCFSPQVKGWGRTSPRPDLDNNWKILGHPMDFGPGESGAVVAVEHFPLAL